METLAIECEETGNLFQRDITGGTHAPRYGVWEFKGHSWCQGAVQEIELVPKTEVGADPKLNRSERPPTGQSREAIRFRCWFRRRFQSTASKVPFSESGLREGDFRFTATKVPFRKWSGERATEGRWIGEIRRRPFLKEPVSSCSMTRNMTFLWRARTPPVMTHGNPSGVRAVIDVYRKTEWRPRREARWLQS